LGLAACRPRILGNLNADSLRFGLVFGQTCPSDFWVGKNYRRNCKGLKHSRFAMQHFDSHFTLVPSAMSQHGLSADIADGHDMRIGRLLLIVDDDKSLAVDLDLCVFQPQALTTRPTTNGHKHATIGFCELLAGLFKGNLYAALDILQAGNFRFQINLLEDLRHSICQWLHQIAINPLRQQVRKKFYNAYF
jgi:hypothetical protein